MNNHSRRPGPTVILVRAFGSWISVLIHSIIFAGWFFLGFDLEVLLVAVSLEAIYIGIFILMAENEEGLEKERIRKAERQKDMRIIKDDVEVDKESLKNIRRLEKKVDSLLELIAKSK